MKIIKRDGRIVDYDSTKIRVAIEKANKEVSDLNRVSSEDIDKIIEFVESLDKKRMLVEDVQDIIEEKLMEFGKFKLAKKYIIYRYKRSVIRQSNTTDMSILSLIKNNSFIDGNYLLANKQRDLMAGEISKDLSYRLLLPKNVTKADLENRIKFCNVDHFTEPVIESIKINLEDMFENGTVINGIRIDKPKSFQSACNILVEIIANLASCQTGNIYVELKDLFKYYYLSYEKKYSMFEAIMKTSLNAEQIRAITETQMFIEIKSGIQTIFYQINTITLANGSVPKVFFLIDSNNVENEADEKIVYEFIKQKMKGVLDENNQYTILESPSIIYSYTEESDRCGYITTELENSNCNFTVMNSSMFQRFRNSLSQFNQGSIIINLARIALESANDVDLFLSSVDDNLAFCYEGFLCRNHNLQGILSDKSPLHWKYGGLCRLNSMEKIDSYLKSEYSHMKLIVIGFEAALKILGEEKILKSKITKKITDTVKRWNKDNTFNIIISNYYDKFVNEMFEYDFAELEKFGINSYYDSLDFIKEDYFVDDYNYFLSECIVSQEEIFNNDIIYKIEKTVI